MFLHLPFDDLKLKGQNEHGREPFQEMSLAPFQDSLLQIGTTKLCIPHSAESSCVSAFGSHCLGLCRVVYDGS